MVSGLKGLFGGSGSAHSDNGKNGLSADQASQIDAIHKSQAVIEFKLDGTILTANENFLSVMGYQLDEIVGKHHSMFVEPSYRNSGEYSDFWQQLNRGEFVAREFKRIGKSGNEIWIQASYNPIIGSDGKPHKVVKFATDITDRKVRENDFKGQMQAINKSQAVIEFELDGTIISANENFLQSLGYALGEIRGKRHSMFVEPTYGASREYREFWEALKRGEHQSGEFKRVGKQGQDVWIQASYNPILDINGRPYKVVKYASDITAQKQLQQAIESVLEKTLAAMVAMSEGDLTHRMEGEFSGQFAALQVAVNNCFNGLSSSLSKIRTVASNVTRDITEIAEGNSNLSERTIEQAANLEQTAASMEQITNTVQHNADNATKANELAHRASEQARKGGAIVRNAVDAMNGLNESSVKISDIIGVINDIAFQTNLLALNASVEAARAGDQGRGFAVVASEVRVLAGRSAAAAKQIKELIEESAQRVDESSALVNKSGDSLSEIVAGVEEVTNIVGSISEASNEQSIGVNGVHGAINHVDELTQQNASLVAQAASASQNLNGQAHELVRLVSKFTLNSDSAAAPGQQHFDDVKRHAA